MDPKAAQTLDPKLKEAYDRVMGASVPTPAAPPATPKPPTTPHDPMDSITAKAPVHTPPPTQQVTAVHTVAPAAPQSAAHTETKPLTVTSGFVAPKEEKKSAVSMPILVLAGVVFFIVYTLFVMKLFGMAIPFLP